jgi:hypothetical protein
MLTVRLAGLALQAYADGKVRQFRSGMRNSLGNPKTNNGATDMIKGARFKVGINDTSDDTLPGRLRLPSIALGKFAVWPDYA